MEARWKINSNKQTTDERDKGYHSAGGGTATHLPSAVTREDFDSKICSKGVDEHLYTLCTKTQHKYEERRTSFERPSPIWRLHGDDGASTSRYVSLENASVNCRSLGWTAGNFERRAGGCLRG